LTDLERLRTGPFHDLVGYEFIEAGPEGVVIALDIEDKHLSQNGVLHGGVALTILDTVGGMSFVCHRDDVVTVATINISVNFLRMVAAGRLFARAKVDFAGSRVGYVSMTLSEGGLDGPEICRAHGSWRLFDRPVEKP